MKWEPKRKRAAEGGGVPKFLRVKDDGRGNDYVYILNQETGDVDDVWFLRTDRDKERFRREADIADLDKEVPGQYQFADQKALDKVTNWRISSQRLANARDLPTTVSSTYLGRKQTFQPGSVYDKTSSAYPVLYRDVPAPGKKNVRVREARSVPVTSGSSGSAYGASDVPAVSPQEWRASVGKVMASEGRGLYDRYAYAEALGNAQDDAARGKIFMDRARQRFRDVKRLQEIATANDENPKYASAAEVKRFAPRTRNGVADWASLADQRRGEFDRLEEEFRGQYGKAYDALVDERRRLVFDNIVAKGLAALGYEGVTYDQFSRNPTFAEDFEGMKNSRLMAMDEWASPYLAKDPGMWTPPTPAPAPVSTSRTDERGLMTDLGR